MISVILKLRGVRLGWWWPAMIILDLVIIGVVAGIAGVAYVHVHGNNLWADYRADAQKRGVKLEFADFIPPPVPDEENYAAIPIFEQVFALGPGKSENEVFDFPRIPKRSPKKPGWKREIERNPSVHVVGELPHPKDSTVVETRSRLELIRDEFIKSKLIPEESKDALPAEAVLAGLERFRPQLAQLHEAAARPKCRFQTDWRLALTAKTPHYYVLMSAGRAWDARIRANLELGHSDAALADVLDIFAAHRALGDEPTAIAALVRISMFGFASDVLAVGLQKHLWTEPQLAAFERAQAEFDCLADCRQWLSSERAASNQTMEWVFGHYQPAGIASADNPNDPLGKDMEGMRRIAGWGRWNQTFINQGFDDYLARLDVERGLWNGNFDVEHDLEKLGGAERKIMVFAALMLPAFEGLIKKSLWAHTEHQLLRSAIAIERHRLARGTIPAKLDDLIPVYLPAVPLDVFSGNPISYRVEPDGKFRIYGVGFNRTDDGGDAGDEDDPVKSRDWTWPGQAGH